MQRLDLSPHGHGDLCRDASRAEGLGETPVDAAQVLSGDVRRDGDRALHVVPVVLPDGGGGGDGSDVLEQQGPAVPQRERHVPELFERRHPRLRDLDLHLVGDPGRGIGPVHGRRVAAGRRGRGQRPRDLHRLDAQDAGLLTVEGDLDGRVVQ